MATKRPKMNQTILRLLIAAQKHVHDITSRDHGSMDSHLYTTAEAMKPYVSKWIERDLDCAIAMITGDE